MATNVADTSSLSGVAIKKKRESLGIIISKHDGVCKRTGGDDQINVSSSLGLASCSGHCLASHVVWGPTSKIIICYHHHSNAIFIVVGCRRQSNDFVAGNIPSQ